ncbi:MAG TPA: PilZ domain-containing protein [Planctomycetaceae bacterium]|jgi:hypothetical protein
MTDGTIALAQHLNSDRFAIRSAVTAIRNAFMQSNQQQLLAASGAERRASARVRLHVAVRITAAVVDQPAEQVQAAGGPCIEAICRDISLGGIGLTHLAPLPGHHAIARFNIPDDEPVCLAVECVWSNRSEDGTWTSGVRILGLTDGVRQLI